MAPVTMSMMMTMMAMAVMPVTMAAMLAAGGRRSECVREDALTER